MKNTKRSVRFTLAAAGILAIFGVAWRSVQCGFAKETTPASIKFSADNYNASLFLTPLTKRDSAMVYSGVYVKVLPGKPPTSIVDFGTADAFGSLPSGWTGEQAKIWLKTESRIHSRYHSEMFHEIRSRSCYWKNETAQTFVDIACIPLPGSENLISGYGTSRFFKPFMKPSDEIDITTDLYNLDQSSGLISCSAGIYSRFKDKTGHYTLDKQHILGIITVRGFIKNGVQIGEKRGREAEIRFSQITQGEEYTQDVVVELHHAFPTYLAPQTKLSLTSTNPFVTFTLQQKGLSKFLKKVGNAAVFIGPPRDVKEQVFLHYQMRVSPKAPVGAVKGNALFTTDRLALVHLLDKTSVPIRGTILTPPAIAH